VKIKLNVEKHDFLFMSSTHLKKSLRGSVHRSPLSSPFLQSKVEPMPVIGTGSLMVCHSVKQISREVESDGEKDTKEGCFQLVRKH
jgi:hypothetical protein